MGEDVKTLSGDELDEIEREARKEIAMDDAGALRDAAYPFEPEDVLALVAEVRRFRASMARLDHAETA